ncbi:hypothetical protein GRAQ_03617 [Rahnella aquatilis CIP 78.65 = ATCC 33071]|uniref:Uncharacterized protein n=1 Tax=Rahnella aquatilis (strain ATCC 33071 / DSM 4594 / JCM 1683 / NBRC 105701 / NCIMB 13365 / CIP 78.65) TaxID=745277 RepID=H2ITQ1_RAHAC|nr:putative type VI secretion system effector [Rahnella aquatilis]AEX50503.1 hypothetical protein Rahaq2_0576 [Rahnella aquatilis CIP 78.65 = ATCC 33071]KFD01476.1 hypothetical protein GRAQ_03617 [Rahnella aquatilis CIP 78.65 = ATCC 33071]
MEKETDEQLVNYTSCLRSEYRDLERLEVSLDCLDIYIEHRSEKINEYDEMKNPIQEEESSPEAYKRMFIDETRLSVIRAEEYLKQVQAEINSFPTPPELPPTKQLIKISGIVEELSIKKVIGYFDFSEYSTEKARAEEKIKRDNEGASLLLLLQFFAGDAPHARFNDGKRKESRCIYVEGKVDGKFFSGWLKQTNIQVGDYVEMAAMPEDDGFKIYAAAKPQLETISVTTGCYAGKNRFSIRYVIKGTGIFFFFMVFIYASFASLSLEEWGYAVLIYLSLTGGFSFVLFRGLNNDARAPGDLFERICATLNIPNGNTLDLDKFTREKIKYKQEKGEWIKPEKGIVSTPQIIIQGGFDVYYYPVKDNANQ